MVSNHLSKQLIQYSTPGFFLQELFLLFALFPAQLPEIAGRFVNFLSPSPYSCIKVVRIYPAQFFCISFFQPFKNLEVFFIKLLQDFPVRHIQVEAKRS